MNKFNEMGKKELRAACKAARVKYYSRMDVATMRAALTALQPTAVLETAFTGKGGRDNALLAEVFPAQLPQEVKDVIVEGLTKPMDELRREGITAAKKAAAEPAPELKPVRQKGKAPAAKDVVKAPRPESNGIKMPGENTKCRAVWDWADKFKKDTGNVADAAAAREWAEKVGANANNALIELSGWKRFHGYTKPQSKEVSKSKKAA